MKLPVLRLIAWVAVLVLILPGTGQAAGKCSSTPRLITTQDDYDHWVYLPLIGKNTSFLPPIIPPTTNPLPPETTGELLSVSADGVTYTFDTMTTALAAVAPGEIIVAAPSAVAPDGFLRRVTAIDAMGGNVVVQTQPATLEDAIQQGEVVFSRRLTPEGLAAQELAAGVTLRPSSVVSPQAAFYLEINDVVIYDDDGNPGTTNDQMLANGSIEFEPTLNFSLIIQQGVIEYVQFTVDARETADLEIEAKLAAAGLKKEKLLGNPIHLQTFVVWVGPVPVVFAPVLTFQIGIDGSVHVGVTTGVTQELTASAGVRYANETWGPVSGLTNNFTWMPPTLHAGLDLKGYASARLQVLVYGLVGPYGDVGPYLKLEADTAATPWWQLYGGIEVPVGVRIDLLGYKEIASYQVLAIGKRWTLAQAPVANLSGKIVFMSSRDFGSSDTGWPLGYDLYAINPDGSNLMRITTGGAVTNPSGNISDPAVSPDGTRVIAGQERNLKLFSADGALLETISAPGSVWVHDWSVTDQLLLTIFGISSANYSDELFSFDMATRQFRRLTNDAVPNYFASWSPDGRRIAYMANYTLWIMNADGSGKRQLYAGESRDLDWSPDGQRIVFEDIKLPPTAFDFDLSVINVDGTGYRRVTHLADRSIWEPEFSPDGRTVAISYHMRGNYGRPGLALVDLASAAVTNLTSQLGDSAPFWVAPR